MRSFFFRHAGPTARRSLESAVRPFGLLLAGFGAIVVASCSTTPSHPPDLGDCPPDSGCAAMGGSGGGGGGSSGGEEEEGGGSSSSGGGSCAVSGSDSQCDQCADQDCCAPLETCGNSTTCENLLSCAENCATTACVQACESQYSSATSTYQALLACLTDKCPVCSESGVGDPCEACVSGLECPGQWCTKACTASSDCAGLGAGGGNFTGHPNSCLHTTSGFLCWPGCGSDTDCDDYPGTFCGITTDVGGASVQACIPTADAGPG